MIIYSSELYLYMISSQRILILEEAAGCLCHHLILETVGGGISAPSGGANP
jgi:hypothetical protein